MIQSDLEEALERLPDEVAMAQYNWRKATADLKELEATLYLQFKNEKEDRAATEIKALIHKTKAWHDATMQEAAFEKVFTAKNEALMAQKLLARMRVAF